MIGASLLGVALSVGCDSGHEGAPMVPGAGPDEVLRHFQRTESRSGRVTLGLEAERGDVYDADHRVELRTMRVDFYSEDGAHMSRLTADSGHVDTRTDNMEAFGHVRVDGQDSTVLTTTRLAWFDREQQIRSEEIVTITRDKDRVTGRGFIGEPSLKTYQLLERVNADVSGGEIMRADSLGSPGADTLSVPPADSLPATRPDSSGRPGAGSPERP